MRRLPRSAVTMSALALAACSGSTSDPPVTEPGVDLAPTTPAARLQGTGAVPQGAATATDGASVTEPSTPASDDVSATSTTDPGAVAEHSDGQAAADRTQEFMVAVVTADPAFCQLVVGLNGDAPMADSPDQLRLCEEKLIPQLEADVEEQDAGSIEAIQIEGANIEGNTARVTADNFGESAAEGFGEADIVLQRYNGQWYVDLGQSDLGD